MRAILCIPVAALGLWLVLPPGVQAAETGGCTSFAWPLATELAWITSPNAAKAASGDKLATAPEHAVVLTLLPLDKVAFPVPPTARKKDDTGKRYGGFVDFDGVSAGSYQVTVASSGWIDVIQNGKALKPTAHTGKSDCNGIRKSVRFDLAAGPFTIQFSGVTQDVITFAVRHAEG